MDENARFHLVGHFRLSHPIEDARELEGFFANTAPDVLSRGVPEGRGVHHLVHDARGERLVLEVLSDSYLRAHEAVLRLRKPLAKVLGKQRIGLRGFEVERYTIHLPTPRPLKLGKIPFVREMKAGGSYVVLELDVGEGELEKRVPDRIVSLIEDKLRAAEHGTKAENWQLLWQSERKPEVFCDDPTSALIKAGWIKHGASRGQWIYGPQMTHVMRTFERIVLEELLKPLGYREMIFPKLVPWEVWMRSGHAKGVYPEIYYVCPPKSRDPEYWEEVMDHYRVTLEVPLDLIAERIDRPIGGMCYAQCPPFWVFLQGETIADRSLPIRVFDRSGTSHRYESGGIHGIERVDEFHRIEIVWVDYPDGVVREAERLQERYHHIFEDILELEWRRAWVTPWFMAQEGLTGLAGDARVGTTDYEAYLPYRGRDGEWLEFQNVSVNGEKYPKGFSVKSQKGEPLWSGCSGVGLERWASAFFAQKGIDPSGWPEPFLKWVGDIPEGFEFL
ncbi:serine--tRNA ligase [Methermicoccus shengliensis]|uniref:Serine--tRNA ligase n=1 Tax=Methermicoccus shengliensis TaxID=660064 RepID=A0A832VN55_9EURY|nr:serine--tRNA ligase [Methermicoccus shengliensis]KUK30901.1 MAG: Type-2 serine--tRNA ligase [Methanosarcinales archeaon 56_1174]MDI3487638.1 seryl-tRNA synthetase [Methanosarcinales archaeon]MDN5294971.1 seryl-tRNA synthetase [Methanosarcinales archaeon]HIH69976.1 serine--tRNA ligase [Methermicoccus shengliensis]